MKNLTITILFLLSLAGARAQETPDTTLIINEVQVANIDQYLDNANCYGAWIEIYNPGNAAISLRGMYLTDGTNEVRFLTTHGSVPAKGFKVLYFDHYQADGNFGTNSRTQVPFKLEPEGGSISLLKSDRRPLSTVVYPPSISRCSYARKTDGAEEWGMTSEPTLAATNATSRFATQRMQAPFVNTSSKVFKDPFSIRVQIPTGATLRYTTDGSAPTATNGETSTDGRFDISTTTVMRFCLMKDGYLNSPVVTRSYIYQNHNYYLPVLSVCSEPKNFFDNKVGIFVKGSNGISGNGQSDACNWNMDWERPVNMELMIPEKDKNGNTVYYMRLNQEIDLEICGGWTRAYGGGTVDGRYWQTRSSFRLKADKRYEGAAFIDYPIFPDKPNNKYRCWQVRNGGNDTRSRILDPAVQQIVLKSGFYVDCQDYQPAHVFLNGYYFGMLNIRESNNKHYGYSNYGISFDDMDQFDLSNNQYNQKVGDNKAWLQLLRYALALSNSRSEEDYKLVCSLLDIDEYCNYMALECYLGNSDWITNTNNVKGFRSRTDGKFHFVLFDCEGAFSQSNMLSQVLNTSGGANVDDLFRYLMKYEPFRRQFIDAFCLVDGSVFEPTRCEEIIRGIYNNTNNALSFEGSSSSTGLINTIRSAYNGSRVSNVRDYYGVAYGIYAKLSANIPEAKLCLNGQEVPTGKFAGNLFSYGGRPINITAKAPEGYVFSGWQTESTVTKSTPLFPEGDTWQYYDQGSMDGKNWKDLEFNATQNGWKTGTAPFGYANAGYFMQENAATHLDYGGNSSQKRPTYYFRHTFTLPANYKSEDVLSFNYQVDDGMMLYVNGREVSGYYVSSGSSYSSYTTGGHYEGQEPYKGSIIIPHDYLVKGENVIAVEVKNTSAGSTDIWFEGSLSIATKQGTVIEAEESIDLHELFGNGTNVRLVAVFEPIEGERERWMAGATPIRINEVSAANDIHINEYGKKADWVELYNTTDQAISLSGLYLSDNSRKPQKFMLKEGIVPAHGTCVVWCDGMEGGGRLHAPFKLDNADGVSVTVQAGDGSWADCLSYTEQGRWQTFGRYPDGGNMACVLNQPTIDKSNKIGMADFNSVTEEEWLGIDRTITLALAKGWNWTSHNLGVDVDRSRFTANAQCLRSQRDEALLDPEIGWQGTLQALQPTQGYKIEMEKDAEITLRGPLYDVTQAVTLAKGWNWIGCPLYNATTLDAALGDFTPEDGDKIIGLDAFATYEDGEWHGSLTSVQPGQSYLLYSGREQQFCWQSLSLMKTRSRRYAAPQQAEEECWKADIHAYPNVMTLVAEVLTDGEIDTQGRYYVGAFCGDECRGVGYLEENLVFMNIHGNGQERLTFRLLDAQGEVYEARSSIIFNSQSQLGLVAAPYSISFSSSDVLDEINPAIANTALPVRSIEYYTLSGQRMTQPSSGIAIRRTTYQDGTVENKKVMAE